MRKDFWLLLFLILFYNLVFIYLSLARHLSLNSTYLDLGLESQVLYNTSQGRFFETSFGASGEIISALSYHFAPIILPLAIFYRFFPWPEALLVLQTLIVSAGAVPLYLLSRKILGNKVLSFSIVVSYFLYPPTQYANLFDFHYSTLATAFWLFAFYFWVQNRWRGWLTFVLLAVFSKENMALIAALWGLYALFFEKRRLWGLTIFALASAYFVLVVNFVFPFLGGGHGALGRYSYLGSTVTGILTNLVAHPWRSLEIFFAKDKVISLIHTFASVGFIALFSPQHLLLTASEFFLNFFSAYNPQWQVKFQYWAGITPFVFVATVYGVAKIRRWFSAIAVSTYLVGFSLLWSILHSPSPLYYRFDFSSYQATPETEIARRFLEQIPQTASVSAMNNLGPHLANRKLLYRFPIKYLEADYVVLDPLVAEKNFHPSQLISPDEYRSYLLDLQSSPSHVKILSQPRLLVYRRSL